MSDMNLADILQIIQNGRAQLENWGITSQGLWIALGVALVLFVLSLREVASWYLRVHQVRGEVRQLRSELMTMQKTLNEVHSLLRPSAGAEEILEEPEKEETDAKKPDGTGPQRFRFDH